MHKLVLVACVVMLAAALCGCASNGGSAGVGDRFDFSSGGGWLPRGFGEWNVGVMRDGLFHVSHNVRGKVKNYGKFTMTPEENAEVWGLLDRVQAAGLKSSDRPLAPDEAVYTLTIGGGPRLQTMKVARNDVKDDLLDLVKCLGALIEKYTGVKPVM
jgi:hypothetical protein